MFWVVVVHLLIDSRLRHDNLKDAYSNAAIQMKHGSIRVFLIQPCSSAAFNCNQRGFLCGDSDLVKVQGTSDCWELSSKGDVCTNSFFSSESMERGQNECQTWDVWSSARKYSCPQHSPPTQELTAIMLPTKRKRRGRGVRMRSGWICIQGEWERGISGGYVEDTLYPCMKLSKNK